MKLHESLNKQVANLSVFFTKLHHYHWYVTGPQFFTLHEKFEALYDEVNELYDAFAERLITIGGKPASNMKQYLELTSLKEASTSDATTMIKEIVGDLKILVLEMKEITNIAQSDGDEQTADLMIGTVADFEKHLWMYQALLK